jgi:DNA-binding LacI/PurR family transcriptional regulator
MVSIKTIAEKSGFSTTTISRYLNENGYVSHTTRIKIQKTIKDLNYKPSLIARSLVTKKSNILGLLIPHISNPFLSNFVEGVERAATGRGYSIFLCHSHEDTEIEKVYLRLLTERRVDGIISIPVGTNRRLYREIAQIIPVVFAIRTFEDINISSITGDDFVGSYNIVKYLIDRGHRRIGFINGMQSVSTGKMRWEGAKAALLYAGIDQDPSLVRESDYTVDGGYESTVAILEGSRQPTAFYAANHLSSIGALMAIKEKGYRIPLDMSLIAFDGFDGTYAERLITPRISANIFPSRSIGEMAVNIVVEDIRSRADGKAGTRADPIMSKSIKINMAFAERESVKSI